ncbi:MAG: hypothetical protein VX730_07770 [Pseudomonadota bacterium]|nr:hypothetical protein [Pseudomonadota bacterium]
MKLDTSSVYDPLPNCEEPKPEPPKKNQIMFPSSIWLPSRDDMARNFPLTLGAVAAIPLMIWGIFAALGAFFSMSLSGYLVALLFCGLCIMNAKAVLLIAPDYGKSRIIQYIMAACMTAMLGVFGMLISVMFRALLFDIHEPSLLGAVLLTLTFQWTAMWYIYDWGNKLFPKE